MRLPPTKGQCHAVFLLVHVACLGQWCGRDRWVAAARQRTAIAAQSYDLEAVADALIDWGLAKLDPAASVTRPLSNLGEVADYPTLRAIASVLLRKRPPVWLRVAVADSILRRELIPSSDLNALLWLGDDLEAMLISVFKDVCEAADDGFATALGRAGELVVLNALENAGRRPRHVSLVSDAFGYDIECAEKPQIEGVEVKTSVARTASRFHLSRNEFDVSRRMDDRWKIIQVVFSSQVVASGTVTSDDVELIRELPASTIHRMAPAETQFKWTESAIFMPSEELWVPSTLTASGQFVLNLKDYYSVAAPTSDLVL